MLYIQLCSQQVLKRKLLFVFPFFQSIFSFFPCFIYFDKFFFFIQSIIFSLFPCFLNSSFVLSVLDHCLVLTVLCQVQFREHFGFCHQGEVRSLVLQWQGEVACSKSVLPNRLFCFYEVCLLPFSLGQIVDVLQS